MTTIAVLGAGSWGTTLADLLTRKGHTVRLWAYERDVVTDINERHRNDLFLPGCPLAAPLRASPAIGDVVADADHVLCVAPSHVARQVLSAARPSIRPGAILVSATKGIETETLDLMSDVAGQVLPDHRFVALSGPSFAREVYDRQPTAVAAASHDPGAAATVQQMLSTATFRVYSNRDVVGTELAGALKNVIAIAAGILDGLGLGNNARAALITRGLAEIGRLGETLGADPRTFAGLAGMGDLILTTCGALSRNRSLGLAIAGGTTLDQYTREHRSVAEGVNTARAAVRLAARHHVELPICAQVHGVLFDGTPPAQAIGALMERTLKAE